MGGGRLKLGLSSHSSLHSDQPPKLVTRSTLFYSVCSFYIYLTILCFFRPNSDIQGIRPFKIFGHLDISYSANWSSAITIFFSLPFNFSVIFLWPYFSSGFCLSAIQLKLLTKFQHQLTYFCFSHLLKSKRKVYHIMLNQLLTAISERKVSEACVYYFSHDWKDFLYVCVYTRQRSQFLSDYLIHRQVQSKVKVSSKMGYVRPVRTLKDTTKYVKLV